jgi:uncharacterized protein (TIGR03083 family)
MTPGDEALLYEREWRRLRGVVDEIPEELRGAPISGTWTIREVMAHVAAWNRELVNGVSDVLAGRRPHYEGADVDDFNATIAASVADAPLEAVLAEADAAHRDLMDTLASLPPERWEKELARLFGYRYNGRTHYGGHAVEIEEWLASQAR